VHAAPRGASILNLLSKENNMRFLPTFLFVAILVLCLGIFVSTKTSPSQNTQEPADIKLTNKTNLQVVKAKRDKNVLLLTLMNKYAKRVTAFAVTIGSFRFTEDFVSNEVSDDFGINPNGSHERRIPIPSSNANDAVIHATLQAVIFEDKAGDGDPVVFEDMRDDRLGQAVQIKRSLKILERYVHLEKFDTSQLRSELESAWGATESETVADLRELRPLGTINRNGNGPLSTYVKDGLENAKADAKRRFDEAAQSPSKRDSLLRIKAHYQRLLKRL